MIPEKFFQKPQLKIHRKYEALRAFYFEKQSATMVAERFGYKISTIYSMVRDFRKICSNEQLVTKTFFIVPKPGPRPSDRRGEIVAAVVELRKKNLSVGDIKAVLDARNLSASEQQVYQIIRSEGFVRLPRRSGMIKQEMVANIPINAPSSELLEKQAESFCSENIGLLCFLPYFIEYGIHKAIADSSYPGTTTIPKLNAILSFLALKLSNIARYSSDDIWCMDRGSGLFAGLNVLPKTSWFSSYSHRVTKEMNIGFLKKLHRIWLDFGLLSDTANLDFVSLPYWGDDSHLENNWSGTRRHALMSILAAISQDPDSGIITYGDATVRHNRESSVVIEFVDFYKKELLEPKLRFLVFDSKFTTYENLRRLDETGIYFLTIRRRGKSIVEEITALPISEWKKVRVAAAGGKSRSLQIHESRINLRNYGKELRQIAIKGHGKIKPALIITNDFESSVAILVRKYARRWLVEKTISEQTHFFHLNRLSSSMVIKVDFDLIMTILAHNLYRLLALDLPGYENNTSATLYKKFICNSGSVKLNSQHVELKLKKKRHHPTLLSALQRFENTKIPWLHNRQLHLEIASHS